MANEILTLLKLHDYFRGASDAALEEVASGAKVVQYAEGVVVHEANAVLPTVNFVLNGRLKAVRVDARGTETLFRMIERGDQFGMMVGALAEPVPVRVVSLEPTAVLSLDYELAMDLTLRHADLRRLWLRTYAGTLKRHFFGATPRQGAAMLALIHETPATRPMAGRLLGRLLEVGEKLAVFGDEDGWSGPPGVQFRSLYVQGTMLTPEEVRRQATEWHDTTRIVFNVAADLAPDMMARLMTLVDRAVYFIPGAAGDAGARRLRSMEVAARGWTDKLSIAWMLEEKQNIAPSVSELRSLACRDFKLSAAVPQPPWGPALNAGLERLVHEIRGVRIGVALGGGAARGMTHLGVLKALERNGIVPDMIAGTSAGAMTGVIYASGLDADYCAEQFSADLRPSWLFRRLPRGSHWYLLYKFRRGQFDPMLRKYLHDWKLEQLPVPCLTVTADLVGGNSVVRVQGDAVRAVLESINLPVLSVPICRDGQALIDGGLVNNIPADVLVSMGCNFVIAVSVTAKMERQFCDITPDGTSSRPTRPGVVQTILRSLLVQNHSLNAIGVQPADVVIEPDVSGFDLAAFTQAKEMAAIGEAAAKEKVPKIQQLLNRLDPQLFPPPG